MLDRLRIFIDSLGISTRAFEARIGTSTSVISRAMRNNTDIQSKWISLIAENYPQLNLDWLLTGKGEMLRADGSPSMGISYEKEKLYQQMLAEKDEKIIQLSEQIGVLKQKLNTFSGGSTVGLSRTNPKCDDIGQPPMRDVSLQTPPEKENKLKPKRDNP